MKQGIYKGYNAGCCDGLEVWGVSCDAPSFHSNVGYYNNYHPQKLLSYDCYRITGGGDTHEIKPDLWPRGEVDTWYLYAARVPGTYPVNDSANRPISSKEDGSWGVQLDVAGRREVDIFDDPILDLVTYVNASRAIYVDGQQTYIAYRVSSFQSEFLDQGSLDDNGNYYAVDRDSLHIINIATQTKESYPMDKIGGYPNVLPFPDLDWTPMEQAFASIYHRISTHVSRKSVLHNNQISGVPVLQQLPCNCISIGKDYCVVSNYAPEKEQWAVGRLKYDGMEVHASESYNAGSTYERIGDVTTEGVTFTNNYWIALPSCRVYLDSTVSGSDECWVCAISKDDEADIRIVTGQWFNTTMAPSGSDTDYADGTLADSEVANTILDTSEFPGVEFPNLQIRCYNRVWDPTFTDEDHPNGQCRDLLIFTTQADEDYPETPDDIEATFEGGDLNTGLEDADIEFTTGGSVDLAGWFSNGSTTYSSDSPITGSYSAKTNPIQVDVIQKLVLAITFNKTTAGYVTFNYRHHNRLWGEPGSGIGTFLSNYNVPENYLDIRLDGSLITSDQLIDEDGAATVGNYIAEVKNNGVDWVALPTTRLDNGPITNSPENCTGDDTKFTRAREVRIWVKAGTHTLSFSHNRGSDGENEGSFAHLYSQVDDLNLGKLMVGGDPTNKTAWIYNGQMVQLAQWWAWPRREEEEALDLDDRISTSPDFITMDKRGRILYGNPHGVVRLVPSGDDDGLFTLDEEFGGSGGDGFSGGGGYVRFTASPLAVPQGSVHNCDDAPPEGVLMDVIADPPWGSFQILPFGTDGDFQVRGANASLRDATEYPFEEFSWPFTDHNGVERYESFRERLYVPNNAYYKEWSFRCSGWTITDNGKHYRGHVEVLWRLTKQLEAYPQGPWNSPPYNTGFDNFTVAEALTAGHGNATLRPRDLLRVNSSESKARWTMANTIIAATYCDSLMRFPQYVWSRNLGVDPPSDPEDPGYWDPDDPIGFGNGPWPSSRWQAILARFMPTSAQRFWLEGPTVSVMEGFVNECLDEEDVNIPAVVFGILRHDATYCHNAPRTDFDVVDVQCVCCD